MRFADVPQFPDSQYEVDVAWVYLERWLEQDPAIDLEPDFQRGHVWTDAQRTAYVEYVLMGGETSRLIVTNCPGWLRTSTAEDYVLVDGLQRITAVRKFLSGELPAFGHRFPEYEDKLSFSGPGFRWRVLTLPTRAEVLHLYLLLNSGGVVHSPEEIARVKALLDNSK